MVESLHHYDSSLPLYGKHTYQNPLKDETGHVPTRPDPFILKFQGRYYCYSSHIEGVRVSVSRDLVQWQSLGFALQEESRYEFWAPAVIYAEGTFYMYYSSAPSNSLDPHDERLRLATSATPQGPFHYQKTLFNKFSIDAEVVKDQDSHYYLFYSTNDITGTEPDNTGTSILMDRLVDFDEVAGEPRPVVIPTIEEEIFKENRFGDGRDWYTVEGASYLEHHDKAYLLYSANAYVKEDYYISYALAPKNDSFQELEWEKYPNDYTYYPLIKRSSQVEGTGHNTVVKAPNNVDDWIVYHGRDASEPLQAGKEQRTMRMDPLFYDGDALMTYAPSAIEQSAPALPDCQEFFQDAVRLKIEKGEATLTPAGWETTQAPFLALHDQPYQYYQLALDLSAKPASVGSKNGAIISYHHKDYYTSVFLRSGTSTLVVEQIKNGIQTMLASFPLKNFDAVYNQHLQVNRCFADHDFYLNGVYIGSMVLEDSPAQVGICSTYTETIFHYFAVTETVDLYASQMKYIGNFFRSEEHVQINPEYQLAAFRRNPATLHTTLKDSCRYSLTYTLPNAGSRFSCRLQIGEEELEIMLEPTRATSEKLQMHQTYPESFNDKSTLTFLVADGKLILLFKNRVYQYPLSEGQEAIHCRLVLRKAALDAYEMVKLN